MEVVLPVPEFHFDGGSSTARPNRRSTELCYFYSSAPTSPTAARCRSTSESNPGGDEITDEDFVFDFSGHLEKGAPPPELSTADELFDHGKIRPLKLSLMIVPKSAPIPAAERGRDRTPISASSPTMAYSTSRKGSRSLSPLRTGERDLDPPSGSSILCSCKNGSDGSSRKWRLKDLFLFRSASEGRATGDRRKDPLRNFTAVSCSPSSSPLISPKQRKRTEGDESRGCSFRSGDGNGSARLGAARGAGPLSPHAVHYAANRAAAEELKKKTALPYRQGFFSLLRLAPARDRFSDRRRS